MDWNNGNFGETNINYGTGSSTSRWTFNKKEEEKEKVEKLTDEEIKSIIAESLPSNRFSAIGLYDLPKKEAYSNQFTDKKLYKMSIVEANNETGDPEEVHFVLETVDPYEDRRLFKSKSVRFKANVINTLVGCNGSGKSTLLKEIYEILRENGYPVLFFDNMKDGGTNGIDTSTADGIFDFFNTKTFSEGEQILKTSSKFTDMIASLIRGDIKRDRRFRLFRSDKSVFFLLDAIDSGYSIDNIVNLKTTLGQLIWLADENDKNLYIIAAANSYELVRGSKPWSVQGSKEVSFTNYADYANFVVKTRNHILKQWDTASKKEKKKSKEKPKEEDTEKNLSVRDKLHSKKWRERR